MRSERNNYKTNKKLRIDLSSEYNGLIRFSEKTEIVEHFKVCTFGIIFNLEMIQST